MDRGSDFQGGLDSNYYSHNLLPITGYVTARDNNLCGLQSTPDNSNFQGKSKKGSS